jgi:uncharacterized NAD(P)/FAD-binding protein YdhS
LRQLAGAGAAIQAFDVALLADFERALAPGLDEVALGLHGAHAGAVGAQRGNEGRQHDDAGIGEQARGLAGAADVFAAVFGGKAKAGAQALAQDVAVQQYRLAAGKEQAVFDCARQGRLAGAGQAGEPDHRAAMAMHFLALQAGYMEGIHVATIYAKRDDGMRTILIVGAGFSGVACAIQLLRNPGREPLRVLLLNRSGRLARGMAYGTQSPQHLLNVVAGNMSVLPDDAGHFTRYANVRDGRVADGSFVARSVYGDYLEWALRQAQSQAPRHAALDCVGGSVCALERLAHGGLAATLEDGRRIEAGQVVLAFGHFPAPPPALAEGALTDSARYLADPWQGGLLSTLGAHEPVLLLGTGLTAVDIALQLLRRHPGQRVQALSRHGLLPRPYAPPSAQLASRALLHEETPTVRAALRAFMEQVERLEAAGLDWHDALAALRHQAAHIWQGWPAPERRRFLRHLRPYWEVHRHQLPPAVQQELAAALESGALRIAAGRVLSIRDEAELSVLQVRPRGSDARIALRAGRVINCTGSCASPRRTAAPLVRQLLADGLMRADALGLGVDTGADGAVLGADGRPTPGLYYIGPWLKAGFWEATAVPELRQFAAAIARACLR